MKRFSTIASLLCAAAAALGSGAPALAGGPWGRVHPAVVRVVVPEGNSMSLGSGALVAVSETHGLVVTNWHVVRDGRGHVEVLFPDGFRSAATVLKADRAWDLAALAIWRPNVRPIPLAAEVPRRGEVLSIAGYGSGRYRMATGRCTQYVSPGARMPFDMIELSAGARRGDSGGPILNRQGELAGVLWGAAWGKTTGSHCRRVRWFLGSITDDFNCLPGGPTMIAQRPHTTPTHCVPKPPAAARPTATIPARPPPAEPQQQLAHNDTGWTASSPTSSPAPEQPVSKACETTEPLTWDDLVGPDWPEQLKTFLAAIGLFAVVFFGLRLLGST